MTITISRRQLYDQVWSKPMVQLAEEYAISDVGLAKLCKKHDIPRPPRGYWAKKQAGKKPGVAPLPKSKVETPIRLNDPDTVRLKPPNAKPSDLKPEPKIQVKETLRGCHELISETKEELSSVKKNEDGLLVSKNGPLDVRVSQPQLRRALLILDAVLKALIERGYDVSAGPAVEILGQEIGFEIYEKVDTVRKRPEDHDLEGRYEFGHSRYDSIRVPSGQLVFCISEPTGYGVCYGQKTRRDGKIQRIEKCLNKIVAGLVAFAEVKREQKVLEEQREEQRVIEAKQREEQKQLRAEKRELQKREMARLEQLKEQVASWRQSQDIREFIQAVQNRHEDGDASILPESELGQWLAFVANQADRLDPLIESPRTILDEVIPEERNWY